MLGIPIDDFGTGETQQMDVLQENEELKVIQGRFYFLKCTCDLKPFLRFTTGGNPEAGRADSVSEDRGDVVGEPSPQDQEGRILFQGQLPEEPGAVPKLSTGKWPLIVLTNYSKVVVNSFVGYTIIHVLLSRTRLAAAASTAMAASASVAPPASFSGLCPSLRVATLRPRPAPAPASQRPHSRLSTNSGCLPRTGITATTTTNTPQQLKIQP